MKRGTTEHPKFLDLCTQLSIPRYAGVRMLEFLWHFTARFVPRGDIGKFSNSAIARALEWEKGAEELIQALVDCRWIDEGPTHRLVIHDWHEHADEYLHNRLARAHQLFVSGHPPKLTRLPSRERETIERLYRESATEAHKNADTT